MAKITLYFRDFAFFHNDCRRDQIKTNLPARPLNSGQAKSGTGQSKPGTRAKQGVWWSGQRNNRRAGFFFFSEGSVFAASRSRTLRKTQTSTPPNPALQRRTTAASRSRTLRKTPTSTPPNRALQRRTTAAGRSRKLRKTSTSTPPNRALQRRPTAASGSRKLRFGLAHDSQPGVNTTPQKCFHRRYDGFFGDREQA